MAVAKVLLIDDEEYFCRAFKKGMAMKSQFQIMTATRGDEGIRLAKTQKPDIILLDIMMPDMAGTQVAEELSEDPDTASIPIIFLTAIVKQEEVKRSKGIFGGRAFVAKPVVMDELMKKINDIIS